jgi:hypothetical protein
MWPCMLFRCHSCLLLFVCFIFWFHIAASVTLLAIYYCLFVSCCGLMFPIDVDVGVYLFTTYS